MLILIGDVIMTTAEKTQKIRADDDRLRGSDHIKLDFSFNHSSPGKEFTEKEKKSITNEALEENYRRGFQHGLAMLLNTIDDDYAESGKPKEFSIISNFQLKALVDLAGEMRFCCKYRKRYSYNWFGDVFIEKAKKILKIS